MYTPPDKQIYGDSTAYKNWMARLTPTTCEECSKMHGKIFPLYEPPFSVLLHPHCQCILVPMRTKKLGYVSQDRWNGADVYISCLGKLPDCYITQSEAEKAGWIREDGNLAEKLPQKMIGGDIFKNKANKLPSTPGRVWYEADIDYNGGYRNNSRILYSSDGLLFVTYDHYQTFYEILR